MRLMPLVHRPKFKEVYWYTVFEEDGSWHFATKENNNDWEDTYNISMGNCYHSEEEAAADWYRLLQVVQGETE